MAKLQISEGTSLWIEQVVSNVILTTGITPQQLREASEAQLVQLQTQLLMGDTWGRWEVAANLVSESGVIDSRRMYRIELALPKGIATDSEAAHHVWRELLRIAIAVRLWPSSTHKRQAYSSICTLLRFLGRSTRHIAISSKAGFWSRATREQMTAWLGPRGNHCSNLLVRLHRNGVLNDAPLARPRPKGNDGARDRIGEPEHTAPTDTDIQFQPFPDAFTVQAGWSAIQMIRVVGPTLLSALEATESVTFIATVTDSRSPNLGKPLSSNRAARAKAAALDPVIANWNWVTPDGQPLAELPFPVRLSAKSVGGFSWPPVTYHQAWSMLPLLQACHLWPIALSLAGRHGEVRSLKEGCIRRETSDTPTGVMHTTKLDGVGGRDHEAPLPDLVIAALNQQERLARLVKRTNGVSGNHLWVMPTKWAGRPLIDFGPTLDALVLAFDLSELLDGSNAHMHRFRKTLVRIVALSLVHAPKILMDVLGHRDEQMTVMRYILSDPGLLTEIQETVRELIVLKGIEAVHQRDNLQGKAAPVLRGRVAEYAKRVGTKAMEPQNLMEFVRAMTEGGTGWAVIAPGIVCTGFTRGGMCNKGQGGANPHYCNPQCDNQLVMPEFDEDGIKVVSAVTQAIETIDYMLGKLHSAAEYGEDMLVAQFVGQVKALLGRWREVDQHFAGHAMRKRHFPDVVLLQ